MLSTIVTNGIIIKCEATSINEDIKFLGKQSFDNDCKTQEVEYFPRSILWTFVSSGELNDEAAMC